ncbi:hypothetical protein [Nocardia sp. A7]|uniref:hypothetical protein n=1 Tax=Nocardia sp. A7 TaxID=2789274 RepID=UPI00397B4161
MTGTDQTKDSEQDTDSAAAEPKGGRPGPTDQGKNGGMATREVAPDIAETEGGQEPPD